VRTIRIGCGAGFSGDRIDPAVELAEHGDLDYLVFECLAERTIALAQQARARDQRLGFDPLLAERLEAVLPACHERGVTVITNMGAANPRAASETTCEVARALGLGGLRIAAVTGDDVLEAVVACDSLVEETGRPVSELRDALVSANAYIGHEPIAQALAAGAQVVITGRAADPSLFVAPLAHAFRWRADAWPELGRGTLVGHLLECAGQVTGGYFADPGLKDVADLANLGFPLAEVPEAGPIVITKVPRSGGAVTIATCKEQLLYEIQDPGAYMTPDVVADFTGVSMATAGGDRVAVDGAAGRARPEMLKVSLGYRDGYIGEGQISYAGAGAVARGRLAGEIVVARLAQRGVPREAVRCDLIGVDALHGPALAASPTALPPYEVRLRVTARTERAIEASWVGREVEALYTNGPAGGGGVGKQVRDVLSIASTFIDRSLVSCRVTVEVA